MKRIPIQRSSILALAAALAVAACGDDLVDPPVDLDAFQGLYALATLSFDPQGSPPAADILAALVGAGLAPTLNVGRTGNFQLFYRDPASGDIRTLPGRAQGTADGLRITFDHPGHADEFLLPRQFTLAFDDAAGTLTYHGPASPSTTRPVR